MKPKCTITCTYQSDHFQYRAHFPRCYTGSDIHTGCGLGTRLGYSLMCSLQLDFCNTKVSHALCTFYPKVWHELLVGLKVICWDRSQETKQLSWGVSHSSGRCQGSPSRSLLKATPESHQSNVCATMCVLNIEQSFGNPIKQLIRIRMAGMSWNSNLEKRYQH